MTSSTDIEPVSTNGAVAPAASAVPAPTQGLHATAAIAAPVETLADRMKVAEMVASGGQLVPDIYRNNPGAVMLVMSWAQNNGVDLFTAMQGVHLVKGNIDVGYAVRVRMARERGYELKVVASDEKRCTIQVVDHTGDDPVDRGEPVTVNITAISAADLRKDVWQEHPQTMLFGRAVRQADRLYVQTAVSTLEDASMESRVVADIEEAAVSAPITTDDLAAVAEVAAGGPVSEPVSSSPVVDSGGGTVAVVTLDDIFKAAKAAGVIDSKFRSAKTARGAMVTAIGELMGEQFGDADQLVESGYEVLEAIRTAGASK